jgi:hypothetical protein
MFKIKPITQSQFWVQLGNFEFFFTSFSGIRDTAATSQYADGTSQRVFQLKGPKTLTEATISSPFDPVKHATLVDFWKNYGCEFTTVFITPVTCGDDPGRIPGSRQIIIPDAQLTSLNFGQVDRTSGNASTIEITFVMDTFQYR